MTPINGKIIVKCDLSQKDTMKIGDIVIYTALRYEVNYRYKSPTICEVVYGNKYVKSGDILLVHHNLLYTPSPYFLQDDLYSIPFSSVIFATINESGELQPICGNLICEEIPIPSILSLPEDQQKVYNNQYKVLLSGWTSHKAGQTIFTRPNSGYTIIYNFNGIQRSAVRVNSDMICGVLKK